MLWKKLYKRSYVRQNSLHYFRPSCYLHLSCFHSLDLTMPFRHFHWQRGIAMLPATCPSQCCAPPPFQSRTNPDSSQTRTWQKNRKTAGRAQVKELRRKGHMVAPSLPSCSLGPRAPCNVVIDARCPLRAAIATKAVGIHNTANFAFLLTSQTPYPQDLCDAGWDQHLRAARPCRALSIRNCFGPSKPRFTLSLCRVNQITNNTSPFVVLPHSEVGTLNHFAHFVKLADVYGFRHVADEPITIPLYRRDRHSKLFAPHRQM